MDFGHLGCNEQESRVQLVSSPVLLDIERRQGGLVEFLRTLVRFDTSNPPGNNEESVQEWIAETLADLGLTVDLFDVYPGHPNVVGVQSVIGEETGEPGTRACVERGLSPSEVVLLVCW